MPFESAGNEESNQLHSATTLRGISTYSHLKTKQYKYYFEVPEFRIHF